MASSLSELEQRVNDLEAEMDKFKRKLDPLDDAEPWWEQITGTFEDDPICDKAMQRGRQYRESLRPKVLRILAAIMEKSVIEKILRHLKLAVDPPPIAPARQVAVCVGRLEPVTLALGPPCTRFCTFL